MLMVNQLNGFGADVSVSIVLYRYWRMTVSATSGAGSDCIMKEITLDIATVDQTATMTNGTTPSPNVVTGQFTSASAYTLFNKNSGDFFQPAATGFPASPFWVWKYDFGSGNGKHLDGYHIVCHTIANYTPTAWLIEGSNDDSTYTTVDNQSGVSSGWTDGVSRAFTLPAY